MAEAVPDYNIITGRRNNYFPKRNDTMYLGKIKNVQDSFYENGFEPFFTGRIFFF